MHNAVVRSFILKIDLWPDASGCESLNAQFQK